jgi:hypothetical protein
MHHIRLAGLAQLAFVKLGGQAEGFFDRGEIVARAVFANLDFQLLKQLLDAVEGRGCGWDFGGAGYFRGH